ncbi:MAG TPA: hypothetical protein VK177_12830 [Flavobacteriales bacterium]|nr:hypothetical protein [Flavobacteriales bacterium]
MNNLYSVISQEKNETDLITVIAFNPQHSIFTDHFPGNPIVPGVVLMQLVRELFEQKTSQKLELTECAEAKFLHTIIPQRHEPVRVIIQETNNLQLKSEIWLEEKLCFKMKGTYKQSVHVL